MIQFYHSSIGGLNLCTEDVLGVDFASALYWEISQVPDYWSYLKKSPMASKAQRTFEHLHVLPALLPETLS